MIYYFYMLTYTIRYVSRLPSFQLHFGYRNPELCLKDLFDSSCKWDVWMKRVYRRTRWLGLYVTRHKLTNCAAFLHHQLYRTLSVLHPEVKHPGLTLYDLSGGDAGRAKCKSRWWQGWRGRGRGGGWRNSTSCCCIGCFWLAQRSINAGLVRFTGKRAG